MRRKGYNNEKNRLVCGVEGVGMRGSVFLGVVLLVAGGVLGGYWNRALHWSLSHISVFEFYIDFRFGSCGLWSGLVDTEEY